MACDIKMQFSKDTDPITIAKDVGEGSFTLSDVAKYITLLSKEERKNLADQLRSARPFSLTESDIKKHIFASNISINDLKTKYPELKDKYANLEISPEDNYILILCSKLQLTGKVYSGRVIDSLGNEVFIINSKYGAEHFFKYLDARNKINKISDLEQRLDLALLARRYKKSVKNMLLDFLNNRNNYSPYKEGDKLIIPSNIIYKFLSEITDDFTLDANTTDFLISMQSKKEKSKDYKYTLDNLWEVLNLHFPDIISKGDFNSLTKSELQLYLKQFFIRDAKWSKARILSITGGELETTLETTKKLSLTNIKSLWKAILDKNKDLKLDSYDKSLKNNPNGTLAMIQNELNENGYFDGENKYTNVKASLLDGRIIINYTIPASSKPTKKFVIFEFPYNTLLGDIYDFAYTTEHFFKPVELYNGGYIYEYNKDGIVHYIVSRHLITPYTKTENYTTLQAARDKIDRMNKSEKINLYGIWSLRLKKFTPRESNIESFGINTGQIITISDVLIPNVNPDKMSKEFRDLFFGTVENLHNILKGTDAIDSPLKAAAFILTLYLDLKKLELGFNDITPEIINLYINYVNSKPLINYQVESIYGNYAILHKLLNDGDDIKFDQSTVSIPTVANMDAAIEFFKGLLGINIHSLSFSELKQLNAENNWGLDSKLSSIRAFVKDGEIYINASNANLSDLFHEISHIFMGILKVKYSEAYSTLISLYQNHRKFNKYFNYINQTYSKFAMQDRLEETVADLIANDLFTKRSLAEIFLGDEIIAEFNLIFSTLKQFMNNSSNSGLGFTTFIKSALKEQSTAVEMNKNMKISLLVLNMMGKSIKEFDCK